MPDLLLFIIILQGSVPSSESLFAVQFASFTKCEDRSIKLSHLSVLPPVIYTIRLYTLSLPRNFETVLFYFCRDYSHSANCFQTHCTGFHTSGGPLLHSSFPSTNCISHVGPVKAFFLAESLSYLYVLQVLWDILPLSFTEDVVHGFSFAGFIFVSIFRRRFKGERKL